MPVHAAPPPPIGPTSPPPTAVGSSSGKNGTTSPSPSLAPPVDPGGTLPPGTAEPSSTEPVATLAPVENGTTRAPSTTLPPVTGDPLPTLPVATLAPIPPGTTRAPSTTPAPVTADPLPTLPVATFAPIPPGTTRAPSTTLPPVTADPLPTVPAATFAPVPAGTTSHPSVTLSPLAPTDPLPTVPAATQAPIAPGTTRPPRETLSPEAAADPSPTDTTPTPLSLGQQPPDGPTPSPAAKYLPPGVTLPPGETLPPNATEHPAALPTEHPANASLPAGETLEPGATLPPDATLFPVVPPTPMPTNSMPVTDVIDTTGDAASGAVAVAVAATGAAATMTSVASAAAVTTTGGATTTGATATVTTGGATTTTATGGVSTTTGGVSTTSGGTTGGAGGGGGGSSSGGGSSGTGTGTGTGTAGASGAEETVTAAVESDPGTTSTRSPSTTLGLLMIFQMQFLSSLRLLEANISKPFRDMLDKLKWLNLHFDIDWGFAGCEEDSEELQSDTDGNSTWMFNTFAVFGFLALLIVCHILLLSYMEAAWLSQANAIHRYRLERTRERSMHQMESSPEVPKSHRKFLDEDNPDRDLDEQEARATERFLRRHNSVFMYFPHVELVFLLFAYQGASVAEARMIRSGCIPLVVLGACALFVFPIVMIFYVGRIVWSRVKPQEGPVTFEMDPDAATGEEEEERQKRRCWCAKVCRGFRDGWRNGHSVFDWAEKGAWKCSADEKVDFEGRKFRIGFEPLFVDFTQEGAVYITFLLFKWFALGIIAGLVTNGVVQTASLATIYLVDIVLLCMLRPFSNSVVQWLETILVAADALTLVLMVWASILNPTVEGELSTIDNIYFGCVLIQTLGIFLLTIPIYADTIVVLLSQICRKATSLCRRGREKSEEVAAEPEEENAIKGTCGETCTIFCALVRENFVGCMRASVYGPRSTCNSPASFGQDSSVMAVMGSRRRLSSITEEDKLHDAQSGRFMKRNPRVRSTQMPMVKHGRSLSGDLESGFPFLKDVSNSSVALDESDERPSGPTDVGVANLVGADDDSASQPEFQLTRRQVAVAAGAEPIAARNAVLTSPVSQRPTVYQGNDSFAGSGGGSVSAAPSVMIGRDGTVTGGFGGGWGWESQGSRGGRGGSNTGFPSGATGSHREENYGTSARTMIQPGAETPSAADPARGGRREKGATVSDSAGGKGGRVSHPRAGTSACPPKSSSSSSSYDDATYRSREGGGGGDRGESAGGGHSYEGYPGVSSGSGGGDGRGGGHPHHGDGGERFNTKSHKFSASGSSSWERSAGLRSRDSTSGSSFSGSSGAPRSSHTHRRRQRHPPGESSVDTGGGNVSSEHGYARQSEFSHGSKPSALQAGERRRGGCEGGGRSAKGRVRQSQMTSGTHHTGTAQGTRSDAVPAREGHWVVVAAKKVRLQEEGIFRVIVGYL
eukprot:g20085.t1